jgi:hypothetical protein
VYLVGQLRGLTTGNVEFRTVPGVGGMEGTQSVVLMDPAARQIFAAIRDDKQLGSLGTQLVNTPPSEANTTVEVIDRGAGAAANDVETLLANSGFDVSPGIVDGPAPAGVTRSAIVFAPGQDAYANVVGGYFPSLPLIQSPKLHGAPVVVVVTATYHAAPPTAASTCPAPG